MILRRITELNNGAVDAQLIERCGDGNIIINLQTQMATFTIDAGRPALFCAWQGRQEVTVENRRLIVDDDTWLATIAAPATVRIRAPREVHALTIVFRPGMVEEVLGAMVTPEDRLLDDGDEPLKPSMPFAPHLQMHDRSVTPVLLFIRRYCDMGLDDPLWYEEQLSFLLERMLARHRQAIARAQLVPVRRAATRREILRRISLATDYIHSSYDRPLSLGDMARAAFLSRHHFLRLFKSIHGVTPHEYLRRKRATVAARLLRSNGLSVEEVVKHVGFDSRSTLSRALRRFHGVTPKECRQTVEASGPVARGGRVSNVAVNVPEPVAVSDGVNTWSISW